MKKINDYDSKNYEDYWKGRDMLIFNEQEQSIIKKFFLRFKSGRFLDLGCGFGRLIPLYKDLFDKIILVDYSLKNLLLINDKYPGNEFHLIAADANKLPFKSHVINISLCVRLVQNLPGASDLVKELYRIMDDGSSLLLSYFNKRNLLRIFRCGLRCFEKSHAFEHKAEYGLMHGTHPGYIKNLLKDKFKINYRSGAGFSYQISNNNRTVKNSMEKYITVFNLFKLMNIPIDYVLSKLDLSLWQFLSLSRSDDEKIIENKNKTVYKNILDILRCPNCYSDSLIEEKQFLNCGKCKKKYKKINNIYDFRL